jgi:hypothetical protein
MLRHGKAIRSGTLIAYNWSRIGKAAIVAHHNACCSQRLNSGFGVLCCLPLLAACSPSPQSSAPPAYPKSADPTCKYVGLEAESTPAHDTLDAVSLIAVFRLSESHLPPPKDPIELKFLVQRSRVDELRGRLEANPEVICRPDKDARYRVEPSGFSEFAPQQR